MKPHARAMLERFRAGDHFDDGVGQPRLVEGVRRDERLAAVQIAHLDARQIDGGPLPRQRLVVPLPMHLHAADLHAPAPGRGHHVIVDPDLPGDQRAGDHRAETLHGKHPIDRQPGDRLDGAISGATADVDERGAKVVQPVAGTRRHGHDGRALEKRACDQLAHLEACDLQRIGVDEIGLRQGDEPGRHAQQPADVEVLARLRHHRFVGGHHQHDQVDAADARQHVLDEPLVPRHIDEGEIHAADFLVREAQVDRDPARLLFLQPIGIGPGERAHQRALPMIDVPRRPDDDRFHLNHRGTETQRRT